MCEPKPIILRRISFLKPVTVATEMIITARLRAIPITEMRTIGLDNAFLPSLSNVIRVAMKNSVFNGLKFKIANLVLIIHRLNDQWDEIF